MQYIPKWMIKYFPKKIISRLKVIGRKKKRVIQLNGEINKRPVRKYENRKRTSNKGKQYLKRIPFVCYILGY